MADRAILALRSYAKINLCLEVLRRRDDGYHDLATVFAAFSLHDSVRLEVSANPPNRLDLSADGWSVPLGSANLCHQAGTLLLSLLPAHRARPAVHIRLTKRLPPGGGLGGGSGNAAAVLAGLGRLLPLTIAPEEQGALAAHLGSDVPFFLAAIPAALGTGRGERLSPLPAPRLPALTIAWPGRPVPTAWAYALLSPHDLSNGQTARDLAAAVLAGHDLLSDSRLGRNAFLGPVTRQRPDIATLLHRLVHLGAHTTGLAGSGACVWGAFPDSGAAARAARALRDDGLWACEARPVASGIEILP